MKGKELEGKWFQFLLIPVFDWYSKWKRIPKWIKFSLKGWIVVSIKGTTMELIHLEEGNYQKTIMPSINKTLHFHRPTFLLPCVQNRCFIPFKTAIDTSSPTSTFDLRPDLRPEAAHLVPVSRPVFNRDLHLWFRDSNFFIMCSDWRFLSLISRWKLLVISPICVLI